MKSLVKANPARLGAQAVTQTSAEVKWRLLALLNNESDHLGRKEPSDLALVFITD